jgi:hypothetical protein
VKLFSALTLTSTTETDAIFSGGFIIGSAGEMYVYMAKLTSVKTITMVVGESMQFVTELKDGLFFLQNHQGNETIAIRLFSTK